MRAGSWAAGGWGVGPGSQRPGEPGPAQTLLVLPRERGLHKKLYFLAMQVDALADRNGGQYRFAALL